MNIDDYGFVAHELYSYINGYDENYYLNSLANLFANNKESIEKLKVTELHPGMKNSRAKYLIDIYYNEKGIEKWEGRCIEQEKFLLDKIAHVETLISSEKNKMKNRRTVVVLLQLLETADHLNFFLKCEFKGTKMRLSRECGSTATWSVMPSCPKATSSPKSAVQPAALTH